MRNRAKNDQKPLCRLGSQHASENYQKAKKDTIWYLFGAKSVFGISQIEWVCLSLLTADRRRLYKIS